MWMWRNLCMWFGVGADAARSKQAAAVSGHSRAGARQLLGGSDQHTEGAMSRKCCIPPSCRTPPGPAMYQERTKGLCVRKRDCAPDNTIADFRDLLEILGLPWP